MKRIEHWSSHVRQKLVETMKRQREYQEKLLRLAADFENYKRIVEKEKKAIRDSANEKLVADLVPILNNFKLALDALSASGEKKDFDNLLKGVQMIYSQMVSVLENHGLKIIEADGQEFDPRFHEAIEVVETNEAEPGHVVKQYEPGYLLKGKLIKPARVAVAKPKEEKKEDGENGQESNRD